jgi:NAD+ kinase
MNVTLVVHQTRPTAVEVVRRARIFIEAAGHRAQIVVADALEGGAGAATGATALPDGHVDAERAMASADLVISFGGDGTFLRAARLARDADVPVVGVNVGRLGFLAEIDPEELELALPLLLRGDAEIELRSTLEATMFDAAGRVTDALWALNDVAVEKVARQRLVRLEVMIGGTAFANVAADAVIVATSTGSTAYALSAGGPIVTPALDAMLVVPVAPHSLFDRTVIAHPSDTVTVHLPEDQEGALVSVDGQDPRPLVAGGRVEIVGGARPVKVARVGPKDFFGRVRRTFRLG